MPQTEGTATFAELIASVAHGQIDDDATSEMRALVAEMSRLERTVGGKPKGTMVLTLKFVLDRGVFETQATTKVTMPPKVQPRAFLYGTKDGGLSENDTRQHSFDLNTPKDVSTPDTSKVRDISDRRMAAANDRE